MKNSLNISRGVSGIGTVGPTGMNEWMVGGSNLSVQVVSTLDVNWLLKESGGKGGAKGGGVSGDCMNMVGVAGKVGGGVVGASAGICCTWCTGVLFGGLVLSTSRETLGAVANGIVGPVALMEDSTES